MKGIRKYTKASFVFIMMGILILLTGCRNEDKPYDQTLVLTVDDSKVYLDEMMYHVMLEEMYGQLYASYMGIGKEEDYWNKVDEAGVTFGEAAKDEAMDNAIRYELFYQLALDAGYSLTVEEMELAQSKADNIKVSVQPEQLKATQLKDEQLLEIQEKIILSTRYYKDYLAQLGIDEQSFKNQMDPEEYTQYDIEYIYGTKDQYEEIATLVESSKSAEDITELAKDTGLNSGKLSFQAGKDTFGEEKNLEEIIVTMEVGEVSDIIETVKGYYILRLKDNTLQEFYNKAVKDAMDKAIVEIFEPSYKALKEEHKIKINNRVWKKINMGKVTIPE